ncbi:hypothetical protein RHGRI_025702 [Rhododendron griersonianum]|uniref:Uncharacterized protein n=1 Tax=Rhododendron griersonianum TaxID=479676 RepID=A0AAV6ISD1_9ERIC|nr:hypothetical protein RHGRI_025702 [Rhododendron griersonianum]
MIGGGFRAILQRVTGYVDSGEMLDTTGAFDFGKSTFLEDLAKSGPFTAEEVEHQPTPDSATSGPPSPGSSTVGRIT